MFHFEGSIKIIRKTFHPTNIISPPKKNLESFLDQHPPIRKGAKYPRSRWSWREGDSSDLYRRLSRQAAMIQARFLGGNPLNRRLQRENETRIGNTGWEKTRQFLRPAVVINANGGCGRNKESRLLKNFFHPSNEILGYHWKLGCSIKELIVEHSRNGIFEGFPVSRIFKMEIRIFFRRLKLVSRLMAEKELELYIVYNVLSLHFSY